MSTKYIASNWRLPNEENSNKSDNYGLSFDGTEYIDCGDSDLLSFGDSITDSPFSISAWINMDNASNFRIVSKYDAPNYEYQFDVGSSNKLQFYIFDGSNYRGVGYDTALNTGEWYHVVATYDGSGSSSGMTLYINGLAVNDTTFSNGSYTAMHNTSATVKIGRIASSYADGKISEVAIFDYALSSTQISTLYGSSSLGAGNPMALKPQPIAFWNLADNSASNPLTQPNEAVEDASVFDFDGSDVINTSYDVSSGNKTISFWFNSSYAGYQCILGDATDGFVLGQFTGQLPTPQGISYTDQDTGKKFGITGSVTDEFADGNWHHFMYVYDGNSKIYIDGTERTISYRSGTTSSDDIVIIDDLGLGLNLTGYPKYTGKISNVAIWNSDQSSEISNIYNSGVPATSYTNTPTAWYKLDQSANWEADSSGAWQIPDAVSAYPQSFDFDSGHISLPTSSLSITGALTISAWVKTTSSTYQSVLIKGTSVSAADYYFRIQDTGLIRLRFGNVNYGIGATSVKDGNWHHICVVYVPSTSVTYYVDGVQDSQTTSSIPAAITNSYTNVGIGEIQQFIGQISNVQVFDSALPATGTDSIETLYNNGSPLTTAIASDNLKLWAKLDNTATFSTNWSIPDASGNGNTGTSSGMTEQNLVNNNVSALNGESSGMTSASLVLSDLTRAVPYGDGYSFNFDSASSDYIDCGNSTDLQFSGSFSISCWVKINNIGNNAIISKDSSANNGAGYHIDFRSGNAVHAWSYNANNKLIATGLSIDTWYHIVFVFESTGGSNGNQSLYINGGTPITNSITNFAASTIKNLRIGASEVLSGYFTDGKISNVSLFNEALTSTEVMKLYANGVPQDLTNFTPQPQAWWPLASNSFWNGSQWIVRDMSIGGSNDGTGQNIGIDGLVGDSPRSSANGVGTNNSIPENLVGTTKWSDNNSWSINMSSEARVTDVP